MKVNFTAGWFAPSDPMVMDKMRTYSGRFFSKGVHDIPQSLKPFLPKSAKLVDNVEEQRVEASQDFKDFDETRAAMDALDSVVDNAEKTLKERRQAQAAKAREAARRKKEEAQNS